MIAPAGGRVVYAAPFRRYGNVVIIDHGRGWMTVLTDLGSLGVRAGQIVARGSPIGRAGAGSPARHRRAPPQRPPGPGRAADRG